MLAYAYKPTSSRPARQFAFISPALAVSVLLHAAAVGGLLTSQHQALRMGGSPTVSVSIIDAVEAHRKQRQNMPKPITGNKPDIQPAAQDKTAHDEADSHAAVSSSLQDQANTLTSEASFTADYLHNPKPQYPALSRRLGEEGVVLLNVLVSAEGDALEVTVKKSSGYHRLDHAAIDVVKRWQFVAAKQGNTTLVSRVDVPLQFSLIER